MDAIKDVRLITNSVEGWLNDTEGIYLYDSARSCTGKGVIVEIGSWKGKSTIWLAKGSLAGHSIQVYAIDPHTGSEEHRAIMPYIDTYRDFISNLQMASVNHIVKPIRKTSAETVADFSSPVELLFIDGAHDFLSVKRDFLNWFPRLIEGGLVVFHDTDWDGPRKVIEQLVLNSRMITNAGFLSGSSIFHAKKIRKNSVSDALFNRYLIYLRRFSLYLSTIQLPASVKRIGNNALKFIS